MPPVTLPVEDPLLEGLSPSQRAAVTRTEGHFLVLAGAGSGKTRVITRRVAYLMLAQAVPPHRILALTFTNKAAREMRERLGDLLGGEAPRNLWVTTFHSLGARLLRLHAQAAGLPPGYTIFDADDSLRLIKRVMKDLGLDPKMRSPSSLRAAISSFKCDLLGPGDLAEDHEAGDRVAVAVYRQYEQELREQGAVDFGDLIARSVELLRADDQLRARYQDRFRYLLVDEYQDTNHAQYKLIRLLAGPRANVCAVGDEDQSIYGWRGADIRNILDFQADFPGTEVLQLEQNYRCPRPVLEAANAMIQHNQSRLKEREVYSEKPSEHQVGLFSAWSSTNEAEYVSQAIRYLRMEEDLEYSDFAVFYRTHAQARVLEQVLMRNRVPYRVYGGLSFYERAVVKDLVCYLRLLVNPRDREALGRVVNVPKRGIGAKSVAKLLAGAAAKELPAAEALTAGVLGGKSGGRARELGELLEELRGRLDEAGPHELLREVIERVDYEAHVLGTRKPEDWEHVQELENATVEYQRNARLRGDEPTLLGFLEEASLVQAVDTLEEGGGQVHLMTLHNAKGLEFPVVFVTGLEQEILPHGNSLFEPDRLEEERRLFYVGMTRAQRRLFLTYARNRTMYGETKPQRPSDFLGEIGAEHLQVAGAEEDW